MPRPPDPSADPLRSCQLCPRRCRVDRTAGETGACGAADVPFLAAATVHRGEEPPISGTRGSGTLFFSHCPLSCVFCQNFPISQLGHGVPATPARIARRMLILERRGAHNVNIVTGTQWTPAIIEAVSIARGEGLRVPVVWNTSGYERPETIDSLRGTVDVYLTDIKYADDEVALALSDAPGYWSAATEAARHMLDQVGPLRLSEDGLALGGVIVRHLVLPGGLAGTGRVMRFVASELGPGVAVSLMSQYFPAYLAHGRDDLSRPVTRAEIERALAEVRAAGVETGWYQRRPLRRGAGRSIAESTVRP